MYDIGMSLSAQSYPLLGMKGQLLPQTLSPFQKLVFFRVIFSIFPWEGQLLATQCPPLACPKVSREGSCGILSLPQVEMGH